jgi:mRNA interferase YafQ
MKYAVKMTGQFMKDVKQAKKRGKNIEKLLAVIEILSNGAQLEEKHRDHDLSGVSKGVRECHIEPDWLLIYEIMRDISVLVLNRTGSHADLF